jgi:hypothetical protein
MRSRARFFAETFRAFLIARRRYPELGIPEESGLRIAVPDDGSDMPRDERAAPDLIGDLAYNRKAYHIVIPANALNPAFFDLNSGIAGKIPQKFVNYRVPRGDRRGFFYIQKQSAAAVHYGIE